MRRNIIYNFYGLMIWLCLAPFSYADVIPLASSEGLHVLRQIEAYLNNIRSMRSPFIQVNNDGTVMEGTMLIKKPYRFRIDYTPPIPYIIISNDNFFIYVDTELEEVTYLDPEDSLLWPLLQDNINLQDPSLIIDRIDLKNGVLRVALRQKHQPDYGVIDLIFNPNPLFLKQWYITDANQQTTIITLTNPLSNVLLEDDLFHYNAPWQYGNKR